NWNWNKVWRSELSDSYSRSANTVPEAGQGVWTGHWVLPEEVPCRAPPHRTADQVRQCIAKRGYTYIEFDGRSVRHIFVRYVLAIMRAAFPYPGEIEIDGTYSHLRVNLTAALERGLRTPAKAKAKAKEPGDRAPVREL